jgi:hypothetical protein
VRVELSGFNGKDCALTPTVVAPDGAETTGDPTIFTVEADTDRGSIDVPVSVAEPGTYSVRFVLTSPAGGELDRSKTESFDVS